MCLQMSCKVVSTNKRKIMAKMHLFGWKTKQPNSWNWKNFVFSFTSLFFYSLFHCRKPTTTQWTNEWRKKYVKDVCTILSTSSWLVSYSNCRKCCLIQKCALVGECCKEYVCFVGAQTKTNKTDNRERKKKKLQTNGIT